MHYRLNTQDFLEALTTLEQRLARIQARRDRGHPSGASIGRAACRRTDRFTDALDEVPPEHPSHDLPH